MYTYIVKRKNVSRLNISIKINQSFLQNSSCELNLITKKKIDESENNINQKFVFIFPDPSDIAYFIKCNN